MAKDKCCICYNPKLDALIYQSKVTLEKLSNEIVKAKLYGYSCDKLAEPKMDLLQNYLRILEDDNRKVTLGGIACLSCNDEQSLAEKIRKLTTGCSINIASDGRIFGNRKDLVINSSAEESWIIKNPYCASREKWEKISYAVCQSLTLDIQSENLTDFINNSPAFDIDDYQLAITNCDSDKIKEYNELAKKYAGCDLDFEILTVEQACNLSLELVKNIIPCDIIFAISAFHEVCDLDLTISRTEEECKFDFNILVSEIECDLDLKSYKKLIECNLSFDIIKTVYENGCTFEINNEAAPEIDLVTPLNKYPLSTFKFSGEPNIDLLNKLNVDTSKSIYVSDPQKFMNKIKQDYK